MSSSVGSAIYFAIDLDADPGSKALLLELAARHPELTFYAASLTAGARSLQAGDESCTVPVDDMRYQWSLMTRQPDAELARLALTQAMALNALSEDAVESMTSTVKTGGPIVLETSAARLPGHRLKVSLRASRLALPPDFLPEPNAFQDHIDEVLATLNLELEPISPAFAHGVDYGRTQEDRCVPVDLYRIAKISAP